MNRENVIVTLPETFSGPLALLWQLIRDNEMDINDIPMDKLADQYLQKIRGIDFSSIDEGAYFLTYASRLLEIKARLNLPADESLPEPDTDELDEDPRDTLVSTILIYSQFRIAAEMLAKAADEHALRVPRGFVDDTPTKRINETQSVKDTAALISCLTKAIMSLVVRNAQSEEIADIYVDDEIIPTEVRIQQIEELLKTLPTTRFSKILPSTSDRPAMVTFFVAVLEMIRQGKLFARQSGTYSDIVLELVTTPTEQSQPSSATYMSNYIHECFFPILYPSKKEKYKSRRGNNQIFLPVEYSDAYVINCPKFACFPSSAPL